MKKTIALLSAAALAFTYCTGCGERYFDLEEMAVSLYNVSDEAIEELNEEGNYAKRIDRLESNFWYDSNKESSRDDLKFTDDLSNKIADKLVDSEKVSWLVHFYDGKVKEVYIADSFDSDNAFCCDNEHATVILKDKTLNEIKQELDSQFILSKNRDGFRPVINSASIEMDTDNEEYFWFDSDKNISDNAKNFTDLTDEFYEIVYYQLLNGFQDAESYEWVIYCKGDFIEEAYIAESFDSEPILKYSNDFEGKNLNGIKQELNKKIIEDKKKDEEREKEKEKERETQNKINESLEQFEKRFDAFMKDYLTEGSNLYETFKLSERKVSDEFENTFMYTYGGFTMSVGVDESGNVNYVNSIIQDYMQDAENDTSIKSAMLYLQTIPYAVINNSSLDDLDDFKNKLLKTAEVSENGLLSCTYKDSKYSYLFMSSSSVGSIFMITEID